MSILNKIQKLDDSLMSHIPKFRSKWLDRPMWVATMSGYAGTWFFACLILLVCSPLQLYFLPKQELFFRCLKAPFIAWLAGIVIKKVCNRQRPSIAGITKLDNIVKDKSFPSSHTSSVVAFAVALALYDHPLWQIISVWALVVSFSRYYVAVHFPSDILAGAGLGAICGFVAFNL